MTTPSAQAPVGHHLGGPALPPGSRREDPACSPYTRTLWFGHVR